MPSGQLIKKHREKVKRHLPVVNGVQDQVNIGRVIRDHRVGLLERIAVRSNGDVVQELTNVAFAKVQVNVVNVLRVVRRALLRMAFTEQLD